MTTNSASASVAALSALLLTAAPAAEAQHPQSDLVDTAVQAGTFATLAKALAAAGLVETLRGDGPFTVFAPTDEAFAKLPEGALVALLEPENRERLITVLKEHVVAGRVSAVAALRAGSAENLNGTLLGVTLGGGQLRVGDATVVQNDVAASNGVIHVIDRVLLPRDLERSPVRRIADVLLLAVDRGVPLFNRGDEDACADLYEVTIVAVLATSRETLGPAAVRALERARQLGGTGSSDAPRTRAWHLRRGIDGALRSLLAMVEKEQEGQQRVGAASSESLNGRDTKVLFAFDEPRDGPQWFTLNDDVMGGISQSAYERTGENTGLFQGALSLENNGGFATVRSAARDLELDGWDGVVLRLRGDGRTYTFSVLPSDRRWEVDTWGKKIETVAGEWQEIEVQFAELAHRVMGRVVPGSGPIPPSRIRSLSLSIADKDEAPFRIEIDSINAYRESPGGVAGD